MQDSDVQRVAEMLLLSIFSTVGKMLAGLSSYRLRTQCFQHVVCRAVAGGVLVFILSPHWFGYLMTEHTHNSHTLESCC